MTNYPYPMLERPERIWTKPTDQLRDLKVHEWVEYIGEGPINWEEYDVTILGAPLSKSSISTSAASENPEAMRQAWKSFGTYNLDEDIDLAALKVLDLGNVREHVTDIQWTQQQIREAMAAIRTYHPHTLPITLGGDHSITAKLLEGWKQVHTEETIGLLQLDTHFDLRDLTDIGPANGTPVRSLVESGNVKGEHVHTIGLHGFFNAKALKDYADAKGIHYTTMKQARSEGIGNVIRNSLEILGREVDTIYLTVDMDVLDITHNPGAPAATPGGMFTHELFESVQIAGAHPKVKAMDIVCLDPRKDIGEFGIKSAVHVMLSFLTGYCLRQNKK
ncbi:agmatinase family protein [Halobacillus campisalis]|uniref:Agmatinase family protein n=1 Tax=Halobacillus campisalis TaxID=435909 RepID=A0ABW2K8U2_9BACI|nr:agmatinase family protein [Halobacillus campisalis]